MKCNSCGLEFEESDLSQVIAHEHQIEFIMENEIKGKQVINHAREVLPNNSSHFQIGANNALKDGYDESRLYQESSDFKSGYLYAKEEMCNKFILTK